MRSAPGAYVARNCAPRTRQWGILVGVAREDPDQRLGEHRVFTLNQAAQIIGVEERSISARARRWASNGKPVSWPSDTPHNPVRMVLLDAEWVSWYATDRDGPQANVHPMTVQLPVLDDGFTPPPVVTTPDEEQFRLREFERLLEVERRASTTLEHETLRAENERLRHENAELRAEVLRWREALATAAAPRMPPRTTTG